MAPPGGGERLGGRTLAVCGLIRGATIRVVNERPISIAWRAATTSVGCALMLLGAPGCVSATEHAEAERSLRQSQVEAAERAGEIASLKQMLNYFATAQGSGPQASSQAALLQLARAYTDLAARYGALAADVEALKQRDAERRTQEDAGAPHQPATVPSAKAPSAAARRYLDLRDPFSDR